MLSSKFEHLFKVPAGLLKAYTSYGVFLHLFVFIQKEISFHSMYFKAKVNEQIDIIS